MSLALFVGVPIVAVCYILVNISFFMVLSYEEILQAEAVALVSVCTSACAYSRYNFVYTVPNHSCNYHNLAVNKYIVSEQAKFAVVCSFDVKVEGICNNVHAHYVVTSTSILS